MERPLTVREALERHMTVHGLDAAAWSGARFGIRIGPLPIPLPNPGWLKAHDLHHVATGFETDLRGECEISAWEIRAGTPTWMIFALAASAVVLGLLIAPLRTLRAFHRGRTGRSIYRSGVAIDAWLDLDLRMFRTRLGIPPGGFA